MHRKTWYVFHFEGGRHASFPQKPVVKEKKKSKTIHDRGPQTQGHKFVK